MSKAKMQSQNWYNMKIYKEENLNSALRSQRMLSPFGHLDLYSEGEIRWQIEGIITAKTKEHNR